MMYSLFMVILGGKTKGRHTEQHDVFFGIAQNLKELIPVMAKHWGDENFHIDSWRKVSKVGNYQIQVKEKKNTDTATEKINKLYFLNLGGYKQDDMEEYHYKLLQVAKNTGDAIQVAKQTAFYKHLGFGKNAVAHIDDKYGIDVDDIYQIEDILTEKDKRNFELYISNATDVKEDHLEIGYLSLAKLASSDNE